MDCIDKPGRRRNDYQDLDNEAMFAERIELAERGELVPMDHVKRIQSHPNLDMYEIRWEQVQVRATNPVTGLYEDATEVSVRLYYGEQGGTWVVGVHTHEKEICDTDQATADSQNQQIDLAAQRLHEGRASTWGIGELAVMKSLHHGFDSPV